MKQSSKTTKAVIAVLFIGIAVYFAVYALRTLQDPLSTTVAYSYTVDDGVEATGLLVREEVVLPERSGILALTVEEGAKVGRGQQVAVMYTSTAARDRAQELRNLEMEAEQLDYAITGGEAGASSVRLDASIGENIAALRAAAEENDLTDLEDKVLTLKSSILKREYTYGEGDVDALAGRLQDLRNQISALRRQATADTTAVTASLSGVFSARCDGYETLVTPANVFTLLPEDVDALLSVGEQDLPALGKLITSSRWYFVSAIKAEDAARLHEGQLVTVSFSRDWSGDVSMRVESISDNYNGRVAVVFSSTRSLSEITLLRRQTLSVVFDRKTGVRVPRQALRVDSEGTPGVYCVVGHEAEFKPAVVLSEGEDYYVLTAAVNDKTSLRAGDEVIVTAVGLYDGKIVR